MYIFGILTKIYLMSYFAPEKNPKMYFVSCSFAGMPPKQVKRMD